MTNKLKKIDVNLGDRSYDILVGDGLLNQAANLLENITDNNKIIIITDKNVERAGHLKTLQDSLSASDKKISHSTIILQAGEATKSFDNLEYLLEKILESTIDRNTKLIALGGGVIGDITGFAASILLRGITFFQIPTTLLAMVDSSVGGKTAINSKSGKNLIGSFYQPAQVLIDISTLDTLADRELLAGYAEAVKYPMIWEHTMFDIFENDVEIWRNISNRNNDTNLNTRFKKIITDIVISSCQTKADIVALDEKESGVRALLNLGHTFAHALEAEMLYDGRLLHGEAVAVGMVMAFEFSNLHNMCKDNDVQRIKKHLKMVGLPISPCDICTNFNPAKLLQHMYHDKKVKNGKITLILAERIGKAHIQENVDGKDVIEFLENILCEK